jgi:PAS domain S-box-containing protein
MAELDDISLGHKRTPREQRSEAEALFTSMGDGAIATDEFGKITSVNPAAETMLGYSKQELIGTWFPKKIVAVTFDEQAINLIDRPITRAFLTGKPVSEKMYYRCKDGQKLPVSVNVSPILVKGRPLGAIEVFRDITLEQEVDRMKSEFISLASHQLRTPLSAIKTYSHMLSDGFMGKLNPPQKKALNTIIGASNRMNELISTLLNITRIESGTIAVTPKLQSLTKTIDELMPELGLMADAKSVKLYFETRGKASVNLRTDPLIVKEIVTNLVSNAIKYTPEGGQVKITLKPRRTNVLIQVEDSGWGIPKEFQDQVFSKFFRAQNIVKRETTGTGLGLYLVKGLVEALGGDIWFDSSEDSGTIFYFTLPRAKRASTRNKTTTGIEM